MLLSPLFFVIAAGNSLMGTLTQSGAQVLGRISYSIYLLHGIVLYAGLKLLNHFSPVAKLSTMSYWLFMIFLAVVVMVCSATYRWIERPFLR